MPSFAHLLLEFTVDNNICHQSDNVKSRLFVLLQEVYNFSSGASSLFPYSLALELKERILLPIL